MQKTRGGPLLMTVEDMKLVLQGLITLVEHMPTEEFLTKRKTLDALIHKINTHINKPNPNQSKELH